MVFVVSNKKLLVSCLHNPFILKSLPSFISTIQWWAFLVAKKKILFLPLKFRGR